MSFDKCIAKVTAYLDGKVTKKQVADLIRELENKAQLKLGKHPDYMGMSAEDFYMAEAKKYAEEISRAATIEKRNAALNLKARAVRRAKLDRYLREGASANDALQSYLVGNNASYDGAKQSVAAQMDGMIEGMQSKLAYELESKGLLPFVNNQEFDEVIAREIWELSYGAEGKPGITKSKEAKQIADIIFRAQNEVTAKLNRAGADIGNLKGRITRQNHDRGLLHKAGKDKWIEEIAPLLDADRTFGDKNPAEFLSEAYDTLITGQNLKTGAGTDKLYAFKGPSNIAKKMSQSRVLHFKDAASWLQYNRQYGRASLFENVIFELRRGMEDAVLMENMGTNPEAAFDADIKYLQDKLRGTGREKELQDTNLRNRKNEFMQLTGEVDIPESARMARIAQSIRVLNNMTQLGGTVLSSISDIPLNAANMKVHGHSFLDGYQKAFGALMQGRGKGEMREIAALTGAGFEGILGDVAARWGSGANDSLPGTMSRMQQKFFKFNFLADWTDTLKAGAARVYAADLGLHSGKAFDALPKAQQKMLKTYDISPAEWDAIRATKHVADDGRAYVTGDIRDRMKESDIRKLFDKDVSITKRMMEQKRDELEAKLRGYFYEEVNTAVNTPTRREQAIMNQGLRAGTLAGEAVRFIMQFKSFPISVLTRVVGRQMYQAGKADKMGLVHLAVMSTAFGYLSMTSKDIFKGYEPRPILNDDGTPNLATFNAAFLQGGGAGILGDFLFGEAMENRFGGGLISTLAGPTAGRVDDLARIIGTVKAGGDAGAKAFNTFINAIPGNNLFYVRGALNYAFVYDIQEQLNPGYIRRMERRLKKEQDREFLIDPRRHMLRPVSALTQ